MVDVGVVIPCYNQGSTLDRAVNSALKAGADQVYIYNDNSTDDTSAIGWRLHKTGNRTSYFECDFRNGVIFARNFPISYANTDWIIPLDADDELLYIPPFPFVDESFIYGSWIEHYENNTEETFTAPPYKMIRQKPLCHATMMFSKAQWQSVGGYDSDFFFGEDYAFQCALINRGYIPIRYDEPLYKRYVGNNQRTEKAKKYWPIIQEMAKEKYPSVFT